MAAKEPLERDPPLREIVHRIVESYHPQRAILVGGSVPGTGNGIASLDTTSGASYTICAYT